MNIYIRPLQVQDANVSYKWRNDARVWRHTGARPNKLISLAVEKEWIETVLARDNERRFAICIRGSDQYIGNVQLTDITNNEAEFHIFIGEPSCWGMGLGFEATSLILQFAFQEMNLEKVYLFVKKVNIAAINVYNKVGFEIETDTGDDFLMFIEKKRLI